MDINIKFYMFLYVPVVNSVFALISVLLCAIAGNSAGMIDNLAAVAVFLSATMLLVSVLVNKTNWIMDADKMEDMNPAFTLQEGVLLSTLVTAFFLGSFFTRNIPLVIWNGLSVALISVIWGLIGYYHLYISDTANEAGSTPNFTHSDSYQPPHMRQE